MKSTITRISIVLSLCFAGIAYGQQPYPVNPAYYQQAQAYGGMPAQAQYAPTVASYQMPTGYPVAPASYGCDSCGDFCGGTCGGGGGCGPGGCGIGSNLMGGIGSCFGNLLGGGLGGGGSDSLGACRPSRTWVEIEYLYWWNKSREMPVLATTSAAGTPFASSGILGLPTTSVLFGGGDLEDDGQSGIRTSGGFWLNEQQTIGIGGSITRLGEETTDFLARSEGSPILARPFFNTALGAQDALVVAHPDDSRGSIRAEAVNDVTIADVYIRKLLYSGYCNRVDMIGGYYFARVEDNLTLWNNIEATNPAGRFALGTTVNTRDYFIVDNTFHGGQIGLMATAEDGCFTWRVLARVALGSMEQKVRVRGLTTTTVPGGGSVTDDFGLLAQSSNEGTQERNRFTYIPEFGLKLGYNMTSNIQLNMGYSIIYFSRAIMAGDIVDTTINPTQIGGALVGAARPALTLDDDDFWVQGLNLGIQWRF